MQAAKTYGVTPMQITTDTDSALYAAIDVDDKLRQAWTWLKIDRTSSNLCKKQIDICLHSNSFVIEKRSMLSKKY